jgi:hypothetical protein
MRYEINEYDSAFDGIVDSVTGEEYVVLKSQSKKLLNLLNDYEHKRLEMNV